ncbi:hypothetical protein Tco_1436327, partial [Tanacetum coccineum]
LHDDNFGPSCFHLVSFFYSLCLIKSRISTVLVVKPHNKTPYELFRGLKPVLNFMRPFGCSVTILNTLDSLGKFDGKSDEENKSMIEENGLKWLFDIDSLTQSMNYVPVAAGTITNESPNTSYFDSPSKYVDNCEPKSAADDQKQVEDGPDNENDEKDNYYCQFYLVLLIKNAIDSRK